MSALSPHIRVLRAEGAALAVQGKQLNADEVGILLLALSIAKYEAANALEAEEEAAAAKLHFVPPAGGRTSPKDLS